MVIIVPPTLICCYLCSLGNRDLRGGAILVVDMSRPDWDNVAYTSVDLARLFMYFHSIPM